MLFQFFAIFVRSFLPYVLSLINLESANLSEHQRTNVFLSVPSYVYKSFFIWGLFLFIIHCDICQGYTGRKHQHVTNILLKEASVLSNQIHALKENVVCSLLLLIAVLSFFFSFYRDIDLVKFSIISFMFSIFSFSLYFLEHINLNDFTITCQLTLLS